MSLIGVLAELQFFVHPNIKSRSPYLLEWYSVPVLPSPAYNILAQCEINIDKLRYWVSFFFFKWVWQISLLGYDVDANLVLELSILTIN